MPTLQNTSLRLDFDVSNGIAITRIFDVIGGRDYLLTPSPLFKFAANNGEAFTSDTGLNVYSVTPGFGSFTVFAHSKDNQLDFVLTASLEPDSPAATIQLMATNLTGSNMFLRMVLPCIQGVRTPGDPANWMGMVSKEAGSVVPLSSTNMWGVPGNALGMSFILDVGLPNSHNNMELASIFDSSAGGGVFFCDMDGELDNGIAPLQFTLDPTAVLGFWIATLPANSQQNPVKLPRLAIGVHSDGDWHRAVDFYTSVHRPHWAFPSTPAWLQDAGAIYTPNGGGAGGIYLSLPPAPLSYIEDLQHGRIQSFAELPALLEEAKALGTNILYLTDYWEGAHDGMAAYFNKGDYIPRNDLWGEQAFIDGIDAVHQESGRVLLYLEPFIVYKNSLLGKNKPLIEQWCGREIGTGKRWGYDPDLSDNIYPNYSDNYELVPTLPEWQKYMIDTALRFVGKYHADGIFLDSYAWQMNRPMQVQTNVATSVYAAQDYARGLLSLVQNMRTAIQQINPEAVVIGECTAGPVARYWDGGLNADLGFGNIWPCPGDPQQANGVQRLTASPVRYGIPEVRMFGNGWTLNGLHQFYAAGHGLALCSNYPGGSFMFDNAGHIKKLVDIRVKFRDALIHGAQINQPSTNNPMVIAYQYQGTTSRILTIVNISNTNVQADVSLDTPDPGGRWRNLLTDGLESYYTTNGVLKDIAMTTGPGSILVLQHVFTSPLGERNLV
jgi:hypothetical protein